MRGVRPPVPVEHRRVPRRHRGVGRHRAAASLIFRRIIDDAIPAGDRRQIWLLGGLTVVVTLTDASSMYALVSARIGEGLIYELRVALFDKVQQMPVAFFTRTQTGA